MCPIRPRASSAAFFLLLLGLVSGCGDGLPRQAISGRINVDGKPLQAGWVEFRPQNPDGVTAGAARVSAGTYRISSSEGLVPGDYHVMVFSDTAAQVLPLNQMPSAPVPPPKEPIPARYNTATTLSVSVEAGARNVFDHDLLTTPLDAASKR